MRKLADVKLLTSPEVCWKSSSVEEMALLVDAETSFGEAGNAARVEY